MRFTKNKDLIAGAFLLVTSFVYFMLSFQIRLTNIDRVVGSRLFPQLCGILLMLFGALLILNTLRERHRDAADPAAGGEGAVAVAAGPKPNYRNTVVVLCSFAAYIYLMDLAGFTIATLAYLFSQMLVLHTGPIRTRRVLLYAVLTVVATVTIYYVFNCVFYLLLPKGRLF